MLTLINLRKTFGGVVAVDDLSYEVEREKILGLIGPNGAGKSTLIKLITGNEKPNSGVIYFKNMKISNMQPYKMARMGIGQTYQITRIFNKIKVKENLWVPRLWKNEKLASIKKRADENLKFYGLDNLSDELGGNLSGGQQKLLELARVSMLDPEIYLLDEPFYGIHVKIKNKILETIISLNKMGKTFVIVSHDIPSIMKICSKIIVMNAGQLIAGGTPEDIRKDRAVIEAYLGI